MAGHKMSKNNINNKGAKMTGKMVTSDDCEKCSNACSKGIEYLNKFKAKGSGNGVYCKTKGS